MDKSNLRRTALYSDERPREIEIYINWYQDRYGERPCYQEIAAYLQVGIGTAIDDIKQMRQRGFHFTTQIYKEAA